MSNVPPVEQQPWWKDWSKIRELLAWGQGFVAWGITIFLMIRGGGTGPVPPPPPLPEPQIIQTGGTGWVNDPDAVNNAIPVIAAAQGMPAEFGQIAQGIMDGAEDNKSQFLFLAEKKVLGAILPSWDQNPAGTCVSFGWGRGCQDLMLIRIAAGNDHERWPGHQVATEPIYGGSRIEIGKGQIRGEGSVGAWAAQWVQKYGLLFRQHYGNVDLSSYSVSLSRQWGQSGVPKDLEVVAREHPVTTVARVGSGAELWAALGNGYPVPVCSNVGYEGSPPSDGIMEPRGTWGHCMLFRGRFEHPTKGRCVVVQNSWGNYLGRTLTVETKDAGRVELPEGCFAIRLANAEKMVRQGDSFAISGVKGFPKRTINWGDLTRANPNERAASRFPFALVP